MRDWSKADWADLAYNWQPISATPMPEQPLVDVSARCNLVLHSPGFELDRLLPFAAPYQKRLLEEPDAADVIRREFEAMIARIEEENSPRDEALRGHALSF
jgi:hypothetical protein